MSETVPVSTELQEAKLRAEIAELEARRRKAELDALIIEREMAEEDADPESQRIYDFSAVVSDSSVGDCIETLTAWRQRSHDPIAIRLCSPGGSVIAGLRLYDYIRSLRAEGIEVDVIALGYAASMGGVILQAGTRRLVGPNAYILIHEVSSGAIGKISELKDEAKFAEELWKRLSVLLAERSTLSAASIRRRADRKDWWLSAEEAVELGFADAMVEA